jgi:hypothetical protein
MKVEFSHLAVEVALALVVAAPAQILSAAAVWAAMVV